MPAVRGIAPRRSHHRGSAKPRCRIRLRSKLRPHDVRPPLDVECAQMIASVSDDIPVVDRIPRRFGLRSMFLAIPVAAVATILIRDYQTVHFARNQYENTRNYGWEANRISLEQLIEAS